MTNLTPWRRRAAVLFATTMLPIFGGVAATRPAHRFNNYVGTTRIINYGSGLCVQPIDANPGFAGVAIVQQPCSGDPAQSWIVTYLGDGNAPGGGLRKLYNIQNVASGQCLDDRDGNTADRALMQTWPCNPSATVNSLSTTMQWNIGFGYPRPLVNIRSNKCLDIPGGSLQAGTVVWQYHCTSTPTFTNTAQVFYLDIVQTGTRGRP